MRKGMDPPDQAAPSGEAPWGLYPELQGRIAWVSGAASGIGLETARLLAGSGVRLALVDIRGDAVQQVAAELRNCGADARAWQTDLSDAEGVERTVEQVAAAFGGLHLAVNNAGISGTRAPVAGQTLQDWHRVIDANLNAVFYAMKHQIPHLLQAPGGGAMVNIASVLAQVGSALSPAYTAAKHGVLGLTRSAALAYAGQGLRINALGPGYTDTPLLQALTAAEREAVVLAHPAARLGQACEMAQAVAFLLSPRASFSVGSLLLADGGFTAR